MNRVFAIKLVVFLLLGAASSVVVAWAAAYGALHLGPAGTSETTPVESADLWSTYAPPHWPTADLTFLWGYSAQQIGSGIGVVQNSKGSGSSLWRLCEVRVGWPARCFVGAVGLSTPEGRITSHEALVIEKSYKQIKATEHLYGPFPSLRVLPYGPIWTGLALNIVFYAAILWGLRFAFVQLKRAIYIVRNRCRKCGYSLRHVEHAECPECGWPTSDIDLSVRLARAIVALRRRINRRLFLWCLAASFLIGAFGPFSWLGMGLMSGQEGLRFSRIRSFLFMYDGWVASILMSGLVILWCASRPSYWAAMRATTAFWIAAALAYSVGIELRFTFLIRRYPGSVSEVSAWWDLSLGWLVLTPVAILWGVGVTAIVRRRRRSKKSSRCRKAVVNLLAAVLSVWCGLGCAHPPRIDEPIPLADYLGPVDPSDIEDVEFVTIAPVGLHVPNHNRILSIDVVVQGPSRKARWAADGLAATAGHRPGDWMEVIDPKGNRLELRALPAERRRHPPTALSHAIRLDESRVRFLARVLLTRGVFDWYRPGTYRVRLLDNPDYAGLVGKGTEYSVDTRWHEFEIFNGWIATSPLEDQPP